MNGDDSMRHINQEEIFEVRDLNFREVIGCKKPEKLLDFIKEEVDSGYKVICFGKQGSGKTLILKTILYQLGLFDEKATADDCDEARDIKNIANGKYKYSTITADSCEDVVQKFRDNNSDYSNIILIQCEVVFDNKTEKYIKKITSVSEVLNIDGELINIYL